MFIIIRVFDASMLMDESGLENFKLNTNVAHFKLFFFCSENIDEYINSHSKCVHSVNFDFSLVQCVQCGNEITIKKFFYQNTQTSGHV